MKNKFLASALLLSLTAATGVALAADTTTTTSTWETTTKSSHKMPELTATQKAEFEAIKTILDKQKAWTTLTDEETATLKAFEEAHPKMNNDEKWGRQGWGWRWMGRGLEMWGWKMMTELTSAEKTALESMTDTEKKAFFEEKQTEAKAKMEAQESVMDKLLAGTTLTADEETVRQEIITQRAEMKAKQAEMDAMKAILEKQKAGTTLTDDETAKLTAFEANKPTDMGKWFRGEKTSNDTTTQTSTAE